MRDSRPAQLDREAERLAALLESGARAVARQRHAGALARRPRPASASTACRPTPCPTAGWPQTRAGACGTRRALQLGPEPIIAAQQVLLQSAEPARAQPAHRHRRPAALRRAASRDAPVKRAARLHADRGAGGAGHRRDRAGGRHAGHDGAHAAMRSASPTCCWPSSAPRTSWSRRGCRGRCPASATAGLICEQAGRSFDVTVSSTPTPNPNFRRVDVQVFDGEAPMLRLSTVVGRY